MTTLTDWIPRTRAFARGPIRGLPRATREVFYEIALEARLGRGVLELPPQMGTVDAIHDLIGGNRMEVEVALPQLTDAGELVAERGNGYHRVTLPRWEDHFGIGDRATSTERVRRHRANKMAAPPSGAAAPSAPSGCSPQLFGTLHETPPVVSRSVSETPIGENRTEQERRDPELPPSVVTESQTRAPFQAPGYDLARTIWLSEWKRRTGEDYSLGERDHARLASLASAALEWAAAKGDDPERFVRCKVRGLLAEGGNAERSRWPLSFLAASMNSTPAPRVRRAPANQPPLPLPTAERLGPALSRAIPRWSDVEKLASGQPRRLVANE